MTKYANHHFSIVDGDDGDRRDNTCCRKDDLMSCYTDVFIVYLQNKLIVAQRNKLMIAQRNKLIVAQHDKLKNVHHTLNNLKGDGGL